FDVPARSPCSLLPAAPEQPPQQRRSCLRRRGRLLAFGALLAGCRRARLTLRLTLVTDLTGVGTRLARRPRWLCRGGHFGGRRDRRLVGGFRRRGFEQLPVAAQHHRGDLVEPGAFFLRLLLLALVSQETGALLQRQRRRGPEDRRQRVGALERL